MHNFTRECQSYWHKNLLPYIRYVATIPCESLRHKSNTFHTNISTLHTFILITFTETSIDETNKTQQKSEAQNLCSKCPPFTRIHAFKRLRHCAIAVDGVVQQPPLPQQTYFKLLRDPRTVDFLLKHTLDAVVHRIQIWRIRWPHLWRAKLWRLSLQHGDSVTWTMCRCSISLKNIVIPENRADIRQKHFQQNCIPVIVTVDLNPWFQEIQLRSTKTGHCHRNHQRLRSGVFV